MLLRGPSYECRRECSGAGARDGRARLCRSRTALGRADLSQDARRSAALPKRSRWPCRSCHPVRGDCALREPALRCGGEYAPRRAGAGLCMCGVRARRSGCGALGSTDAASGCAPRIRGALKQDSHSEMAPCPWDGRCRRGVRLDAWLASCVCCGRLGRRRDVVRRTDAFRKAGSRAERDAPRTPARRRGCDGDRSRRRIGRDPCARSELTRVADRLRTTT